MTPVDQMEERSAAEKGKRGKAGIFAAHVMVIAVCPLIGSVLFSALHYDLGSFLSLGGIATLLLIVLVTYLFAGLFTVIATLAASPILFLVSKLPGRWFGFSTAVIFGAAFGWIVCSVWVKGFPAVKTAVAVSAAFGAGALEAAWRKRSAGAAGM